MTGVLVVTLDDFRFDELPLMPFLRSLAPLGTTWPHARVTVASCTPMRSSFLMGTRATGPNGHGIVNTSPFLTTEQLEASLPTWLDAEDVECGHFGKWYIGTTAAMQPGWTDMRISTGTNHNHETGYSIWDSSIPGTTSPGVRQSAYLAAEIAEWIAAREGDWFAWLCLHQPHIPNEPSDESAERYRVRSVAYAAADLTGKPAFAQAFAVPTDEQIALMQQASRTRAQAALDADRLIQAAVAALDLSVDTIIISSDNGASFLEFNQPALTKTTAWEHSTHVPMIAVGPRFPARRVNRSMVQVGEDTAITVADIFGAVPPHTIDGHVLSATEDLDSVCVGHVPAGEFGGLTPSADWIAAWVDGTPWKYTRWSTGESELYDLAADPGETTNLAAVETGVASTLDSLLDSELGA